MTYMPSAKRESQISKAMHVLRLRIKPFRSGGRWISIPQSRRVREQREAMRFWLRRDPRWPKPWQPPEGRESPREDWMSWRRSMVCYEFAGSMRFKHGKGPPLVGRARLYDPFSPRVSPFA